MSKLAKSKGATTTRRKAREVALQILFQEDFNREGKPFFASTGTEEMGSEISDFSRQLVEGVHCNCSPIDQLIEKQSEHWSTERMAVIDHNILRMAIFEILFLKETPPKVVLNEAIEIAKKYGNEHSGAFVNGILNSIHQGSGRPANGQPPLGILEREGSKPV